MLIIPLQAVPSQTVGVLLSQQQVQLNVYQRYYGLFIDIYVDGNLILAGQFCANQTRIVRSAYLGFKGDLAFVDTQGTDSPVYTGLGTRFQLEYLEPADLGQVQISYTAYVNSIAGLSDVLARYPQLGTTIASIPSLNVLSLGGISFVANSVQGTTIGAVLGTTFGSTVSLVSSFASALQLSNINEIWQLQVGSNPTASPQSFSVSLTETLAGYSNSPNTTTNLVVFAVARIQLLGPLSLGGSTFIVNSAPGTAIGVIIGTTAGSSVSLVNTFGAALQLINMGGGWLLKVGTLVTPTPQNFNVSIIETLAGYTNSPRTTINLIVSALPAGGVSSGAGQLVDGLGVVQ